MIVVRNIFRLKFGQARPAVLQALQALTTGHR